MGVCCTGKITKNDFTKAESDIIRSKRNNNSFTANVTMNNFNNNIWQVVSPQINPSVNYLINWSTLSSNITKWITKYNSIGVFTGKIGRINWEEIYNIYLTYKNDFTNCTYLILDLRVEKKENFIKKFKHINYTYGEMQVKWASETKFSNFLKYWNKKNIICLWDSDITEGIEEIINLFNEKQLTSFNRLLIVDSDWNNHWSFNNSTKHWYEYWETNCKIIDELPYILCSCKFFPHLKNENNFVFFTTAIEPHLSTEYVVNNHQNKSDPYYKFMNDFHILNIITFTYSCNSRVEITKKENKMKGDCCLTATSVVLGCEEVTKDSFGEYVDNISNILVNEIEKKHSVLLEFDSTGMKNQNIIKILCLLLWKVTNVSKDLLLEYLEKFWMCFGMEYKEDVNKVWNEFGINKDV